MVGGYQRMRREARPRSKLGRPAALIGALITRGNSGPNDFLLPKAVRAWSHCLSKTILASATSSSITAENANNVH